MSGDVRLRSEAEQETARRRSEFIAGVSHDLKTPLNGIIGFTSVMLMDVAGQDAELEKKLRLVFESAGVMLERINALVAFHRLEAGVITVEPEWLAPAVLVAQAVEAMRAAFDREGLSLEVESGGPARIQADLKLLNMALHEILANALRFGRRGRVRLWLETEQREDDQVLRFCVADEGIGFQPEKLEAIRRGLRSDRVADQFEGLGLGLALARLSMACQGGWIEVDSPSGQETTFRLCLPLLPAQWES